jgi:hypothetical protein
MPPVAFLGLGFAVFLFSALCSLLCELFALEASISVPVPAGALSQRWHANLPPLGLGYAILSKKEVPPEPLGQLIIKLFALAGTVGLNFTLPV